MALCEPVVQCSGSHYSFMFGKPWNQMSAKKLDFVRFLRLSSVPSGNCTDMYYFIASAFLFPVNYYNQSAKCQHSQPTMLNKIINMTKLYTK